MNRVRLNKEEANWLGRNVMKLIDDMARRGAADPKLLERTTYKILASLQTKASLAKESQDEANDLILDRKQKQLLQGLAETMKNNLTGVIDEYQRRGPDYEQYRVNAVAKKVMLGNLARKLR